MGTFYILSDGYAPNQAYTNHNMAFLKGFSALGVRAELVYIMPDGNGDIMQQEYSGISVRYLWNRRYVKNRLLRNIYMCYSFCKFLVSLKKGDTLLLLGCSEYLFFWLGGRELEFFMSVLSTLLHIISVDLNFFVNIILNLVQRLMAYYRYQRLCLTFLKEMV